MLFILSYSFFIAFWKNCWKYQLKEYEKVFLCPHVWGCTVLVTSCKPTPRMCHTLPVIFNRFSQILILYANICIFKIATWSSTASRRIKHGSEPASHLFLLRNLKMRWNFPETQPGDWFVCSICCSSPWCQRRTHEVTMLEQRTKVLLSKAVAAAHPWPAAMCAVVTEFPSPSQLEGKLGFWQEAELNPICNNQPGSRWHHL